MFNLLLIFKMFWREFKAQKKRMFLTIIAIMWGTMSISILLAFGDGLRSSLHTKQMGLGKGIMIVWGGQTSKPYKGLPRGRRIRFTREDVKFLKENIPEIEMIGGEYIRWGVPVANKTKLSNAKVNGVDPEYEDMRTMYPQAYGRFINKLDVEKKRRVVFLGHELAADLFGAETPAKEIVGKTIEINRITFTVIGVMVEKMQMGMYSGPDSECAVIPISTFEGIWWYYRYLGNIVVKRIG